MPDIVRAERCAETAWAQRFNVSTSTARRDTYSLSRAAGPQSTRLLSESQPLLRILGQQGLYISRIWSPQSGPDSVEAISRTPPNLNTNSHIKSVSISAFRSTPTSIYLYPLQRSPLGWDSGRSPLSRPSQADSEDRRGYPYMYVMSCKWHIYIYIETCMCVCMYVCMSICM